MKKRALMVWGGWEGHESKECVDIFALYLHKSGYDVRIFDSLDVYLDSVFMHSLDLIVPNLTIPLYLMEKIFHG
jgi:type 1 glutamine amidotransferase